MQRVFASFPEAAVLSIQLEGGALNTTCLERVSFPAAGMLTRPEGGALNTRYPQYKVSSSIQRSIQGILKHLKQRILKHLKEAPRSVPLVLKDAR